MDTTAIRAAVGKMNLEQLREVNRIVVGAINGHHAARAQAAAARFKIGDLIEFTDDKRHRKVRARVNRINQKTLGCTEVDGLRMNWRVSPNLARLVGA